MRFSPRAVLLGLSLSLMACPETPPVVEDGGVDAGCAGQLTCECKEGASCDVGECVGGTCTDCRRGAAACICRGNGTCDTGLRCQGATCQTCPAGEEGCACGAGDTCGTGLICSTGTCVVDTCVAGSAGCPCRTSGQACDGTGYCDGSNLCRACSSDVAGCACDSNNMCQGTTVCDTGTTKCRDVLTCANLVTSGACLPNQACVETSGADAVCTPAMCNVGFQWNGAACQACVSTDCMNEPRCTALDGGLGSTCAAQNRVCTSTGQVDSCGACLEGFTLNAANECVPAPTCGTMACPLTQYCDRTGAPQCVDLPCPAGQARGATGVCAACSATICQGPGFSGRVWPFRTGTNDCVCETLDNYFIQSGGAAAAERCDADNDGWVRSDAVTSTDPAYRDNARCNVRTVDRVRLFDEYGLWVDVLSCTNGLLKATPAHTDGGYVNAGLHLLADGGLETLADGGTGCDGFMALRLLETSRNDLGAAPSTDFPVYTRVETDGGSTGRALEAGEVNALTKACVSAGADFNHNGAVDLTETQETAPLGESARLRSFSYFIELQESWYESRGAGSAGTLVIRERSRCDAASFPLHYDTNEEPGAPYNDAWPADGGASNYWRNCERNRDVLFDGGQAPNTDFGRFTCGAASGTCDFRPGPAHPQYSIPINLDAVMMRDFGVCNLGGQKPADGRWRGLNHHSQFKCMAITATATNPAYQLEPNLLGPIADNLYTFNVCGAAPCATPGDPACTRSLGTGAQSRQPHIECVAVPTASNTVGMVAVNFRPGPYTRGCIDEDTALDYLSTGSSDTWKKYICPEPQYQATYPNRSFGRYSCYNQPRNFLWAADSNDTGIWTLTWGPNANESVLR